MIRPRSLILACTLAAGCALPVLSLADDADLVQRRSDLEEVQRRIAELETIISDAEASRSAAAAKLAAAERAVSDASRRLRQLSEERAEAEADLVAREAERRAVEERIASRQAELAGWLRRHYMHGGSDMAPFLSGRDLNQLARDARYLEQVGRARVALIGSLRSDLREHAQLVASIEERRDGLIALEAGQRRQQAELQKVQRARAGALDALALQIGSQEREMQVLRRNEEELGRVMEVLALRAERREIARAQQLEREVPATSADESQHRAATAVERSGPSAGQAGRTATPAPPGVRFAQLRGKLGFPVRGELIGRFNAQRADGGTRWRGVFIRAGGGEDVVAVAPGEVVYSDWLRGYGNLIIVDHGDDYLTIYGNNDALFKVVGERIGGGTPIASVGASGGAPESGLYFEIRHKGEPVDPLQWIRAR